MRKTFLALALTGAVLTSACAIASETTDAMAPVHQLVDSFNKGDMKSAVAACADETAVIDDFPPHVWQGAGACERWAAGFEAMVTKEGITDARIALGKYRHADVTDDRAYVVVPVTLVYKKNGKSKKLAGMLTAALHHERAAWRIVAWTWTDL